MPPRPAEDKLQKVLRAVVTTVDLPSQAKRLRDVPPTAAIEETLLFHHTYGRPMLPNVVRPQQQQRDSLVLEEGNMCTTFPACA
jgi:hypothetical protein